MSETPSGLFPDYMVQWDMRPVYAHATEVSVARNGREQRRAVLTSTGLRQFTSSSATLDQTARKAVVDFFNARRGKYQAFYFWMPIPQTLTAYACGSVSGSATFTVPIKGPWTTGVTPVAATYSAVYVGGVSKTFTVSPNVGLNGEDQITFSGGAQTGAVTVDATHARLRLLVRFDTDGLQESFVPSAGDVNSVISIAIKEVF